MPLHLLKMCVGCESIQSLKDWQSARIARGEPNEHQTRNRPRRDEYVLNGGSLYWIIKGQIRVRQRILSLDPGTEPEGRSFCRIGLDPVLVETLPTPYRPMQGWRYLEDRDAPVDLADENASADTQEMVRNLKALGLL